MKILSYILSTIFGIVFGLILIIFQPIQWIGLRISQEAHHKTVNALSWFLNNSLLILGVRLKFDNPYKLPENQTCIFVSNHQGMFDITPIGWVFRKQHPKFVSKKELAKGIPSISFNLKYGGAALINRKNPKQAIAELIKYSKRINENNWSAVIFPEGTRSRDGNPKPFASKGLQTIIKYNKDALVVPITINNSWKIFNTYGKFPFGIGSPITIKTHQPVKADSMPFEELMTYLEEKIKGSIL